MSARASPDGHDGNHVQRAGNSGRCRHSEIANALCITLDYKALCRAVDKRSTIPVSAPRNSIKEPARIYCRARRCCLSKSDTNGMIRIVLAIEAAARLCLVTARPPCRGHRRLPGETSGLQGAFMGYDFHLAPDGPRLIEVNTNAGGAFLNALLAKAQLACCSEVDAARSRSEVDRFDAAVLHMFTNEWIRQRESGRPRRVAIVDDRPAEQYLLSGIRPRRAFLPSTRH